MYEGIRTITNFMATILLAKFVLNDVPHAVGLLKPNPNDIGFINPKGTCYQDAWRFVIKQEAGELIHGSVMSTGGKRTFHAWVITDTGYVWEPQTKQFYEPKGFEKAMKPIIDARYTPEQAAIMVAKTGHMGYWTSEQRELLVSDVL